MRSTRSSATSFDRDDSPGRRVRGAAARRTTQIPGVVLAYPGWLQAYRNDRFTGWVPRSGRQRLPVAGLQLRLADRAASRSTASVAGSSGSGERAGLALARGDRGDRGGRDRLGATRPPPRARRGVERHRGRRRAKGTRCGHTAIRAPQGPAGAHHARVRAHDQLLHVPGAARAIRWGCSRKSQRLTEQDVAAAPERAGSGSAVGARST